MIGKLSVKKPFSQWDRMRDCLKSRLWLPGDSSRTNGLAGPTGKLPGAGSLASRLESQRWNAERNGLPSVSASVMAQEAAAREAAEKPARRRWRLHQAEAW